MIKKTSRWLFFILLIHSLNQGFCQQTCTPQMRFDGKKLILSKAEWKERLPPLQFRILREEGGTGPPFHNLYFDNKREGIRLLQDQIDQEQVLSIWELALKTEWNQKPVWVHGDISPGNLLIEEGKLRAIIDFGLLAAGDLACDLAIAWTFFDLQSREIFLESLSLDTDAVSRAKGWALWKAVITASGLSPTNALSTQKALTTIQSLERIR